MKLYKKNIFFLFFISVLSCVEEQNGYTYYGKKIKSEKNNQKQKVARCIAENMFYFVPDDSFQYFGTKYLSPTGLARNKITTWYNVKENTKQIISHGCSSSNKAYIDYVRKHIDFFLTLIDDTITFKNDLQRIFYLSYFLNLVELGNTIKDSLDKIIVLTNNYSFIFDRSINSEDIISLLLLKRKSMASVKKIFDMKAASIISKNFIFNSADKIEKERIVNRIINVSDRKSVVLIISKFSESDFTLSEINNTYGELDPSRDIYEKILFENKINFNELLKNSSRKDFYINFNDRFELEHRNLPSKKPVNTISVIALPEVTSSMVNYSILKINEENNDNIISVISLENYINSLPLFGFYSVQVIALDELFWLVTF